MSRRNQEYWLKRAQENEKRSHEITEQMIKKLREEYETAAEEIEQKIATFFARYANEQGISYAESQRLLTAKETKQWLKSLGEYMAEIKALPEGGLKKRLQAELDARAYASRISRLDALKAQIDLEVDRLMMGTEQQLTDGLITTYSNEYYHKLFDIQQRAERMFPFARLDAEMVEEVLYYPWSGADFSDRLWKNKSALIFNTREILTQGIIQGKSVTAMSKQLESKLQSSYSAAETLIRTETSRIHNDADKGAYEAAGVEQYEFMATNQERTCEVCGELDGEIFPISKAQTGVNYPPIHPRCRCTTVEYDPDEWKDWEAIGEPMPKRMTYKEWYRKRVSEHGEAYAEVERKKIYNLKSDRAQFERYKEVLGDHAPKTVAEFQDLKYNDSEKWNELKERYRYRNSLQKTLNYSWNGEKSFIPKGTKFEKVITIAGYGTDEPIRCIDKLVKRYGGDPSKWKKQVGKIVSEKYVFDVHWYEIYAEQFEMKLKNRGDK